MLRELNADLPGAGFLDHFSFSAGSLEPMPKVEVSEAASYACRFWVSHLLDMESDSTERNAVVTLVRQFVSSCFGTWVEIVISNDEYVSLLEIHRFVKVSSCWNSGRD
jgi:hypothetical protein